MERTELYQLIHLPECLYDWVENVYTENDWNVLATCKDGIVCLDGLTEEAVRELYGRGVLNKKRIGEEVKYVPATFDTRFSCLVEREKELWKSFPDEQKDAITKVMMDPTIWLAARLEALEKGLTGPEIVSPLEDAIKLIEETDGIITSQQCGCQPFTRGCDRNKTDVCIHVFPEGKELLNLPLDRGNCKVVSKDEAIAIVKRADKDGLVHSLFTGGHIGMCNCCSCCCYNLTNADKYPIKDNLLKTPYRARIDQSKCKKCKLCMKQCPFQAIYVDDNGNINVNEELCWGCGVCRAVCRADALNVYKK